MTRMLWTFLLAMIVTSTIGGCSLFSGESEEEVAGIDTESVSSEDVLLGAEDEMLEESSDLVESSDFLEEELADNPEFALEAGPVEKSTPDPESDVALDNEFESAELGGFDDELLENEFSDTQESQIDPILAQDELNESEDFDEFDDFGEGEGDTMAKNQGAVIDEPAPDEPIVDLPEQSTVAAASYDNQVTNLEYKAFENGGTVVIETSSPTTYKKIVDPELNQLVVQVDNVFLPERFKRPYITKDFKQDIATINAYADEGGAARFVIQLKRPIEPQIVKEGNSILVMTGAGAPMTIAGQQAEGSSSEGHSEQSLDQLVAENKMKVEPQPLIDPLNDPTLANQESNGAGRNELDQSFGGSEKSGLTLNPSSFSGEMINLEFVDTDVRSIIEVIAERSGVNLIMDQEVSGKTSLRLRQVPWDQALLVLLRSQGLGYVKQGSVLRIAKQETLAKEAQAVSNQIKSEKEAKLLSGGIKVKYIPVSYAKVSELAGKLKEFTSKEGKIAFDDRTSSLVITDYGEYIERIVDLVKALDTAPMQVEIESKLVEAREDFIREAGIEWDIGGQEFPFGSQTGNISSGLSSSSLPQSGFSLDLNVGSFDIFGDLSAALRVFENQSKIKVLSQPRIVTMNKVEANIEQKTSIPIQVSTIQAGAPPTVTFEFVDLTLSLKVTPQITFKGDVILDVELKREFAGSRTDDGQRDLNKRFAKSTVMVKNGKTAVLGGIYQQDDGDLESGIPLLKDIPLIGYLFKSLRVEKIKNELLLFLKPKILKEVEGPMVTKSGPPGKSYDPFEELSVDEGSQEVSKAPKAESLFEDDENLDFDFGEEEESTDSSSDESFDDSFDDSDFI